MKKVFTLLIAVAFLIIGMQQAKAQTTLEVPDDYTTIQAAIDAADTGDVIIVAEGTYEEQVVIHGSELNGISLIGAVDGNGDPATELKLTDLTTTGHGIDILNVEDAVIKNFEIYGAKNNRSGIHAKYTDGILVENIYSYNHTKDGIRVRNSKDATIKDCISINNSGDGITFYSVGDSLNNQVGDNGERGIHPQPSYGDDETGTLTIANNIVYGNTNDANFTEHKSGGIVYNDANFKGDVVIENNDAYENYGPGIIVYKFNHNENNSSASCSVKGNTVYKNKARPELNYEVGDGIVIYLSNYVTVDDNTVYDNDYSGIRITNVYGYSTFGPTTNITVNNNDVYDNPTGVLIQGNTNHEVTDVSVNNNILLGSYSLKNLNNGDETIDATCNWWGTDVESEIANLISGSATYTPYSVAEGGACAGGLPPIVTTIETPTSTTCGTLDVPVTVQGFNDVGSISLKLNYNNTELTYDTITVNPAISGATYNEASGAITLGQFSSTGATLEDDDVLFTMHFTVVPDINGTPVSISWADDVAGNCEFAGPGGTPVYTSTFADFSDVIITDEEPEISCPGDITVDNDPGECGAVVTYTAPVGTDNCPDPVTTQVAGLASGSLFPVGTTTNTFEVTDSWGNVATCSFTVTVNDTEAPEITGCPDDITIGTGEESTSCDQVVSWTPPTATDNCGMVNLTSDWEPGDTFPVGTTTVTYTATDYSVLPGYDENATIKGVVRYKSFNSGGDREVYVGTDNGINNSVSAERSETDAVWTTSNHVVISYNSSTGDLESTLTAGSNTYVTTYNIGTVSTLNYLQLDVLEREDGTTVDFNNVTLNGTSLGSFAGGNPGSHQLVGLDFSGDFTLEGDIELSDNQPSSSEMNRIQISFGSSTNSFAGNTTACSFDVTVEDNTKPTLDCGTVVNLSVDENCEVELPDLTTTITASDNCTPGSTGYGVAKSSSLNYSDGGWAGWSAPTGTVVTGGGFELTGGPAAASTLGTPGTSWPHGHTFGASEYGWVVQENQDGTSSPGSHVYAVHSNAPSGYEVITHTISGWNTTGWGGWSCPAGKVVLGGGFEANGPVKVSAPAGPNTSWPHHTYGNDEYGWVVQSAGATEVTITVICADEPDGYQIVKSGAQSFSPTGWAGWSVPGKQVMGGGFECENPVRASRPSVPDETTPSGYPNASNEYGWVVQSNGGGTGYIYVIYADPAPSLQITQSPAAGTQMAPGTHSVTFTVTDAAGNTSTCSKDVIVTDDTAPSITCVDDQNRGTDDPECTYTATGTEFDPTADDNCGITEQTYELTGATTTSGPVIASTLDGVVFNKGETTVTWTVKDAAENENSCSFTVEVVDDDKPTITCPSAITVNMNDGCTFVGSIGDATATDNCTAADDINIWNDAPTSFPYGIDTVTWYAEDAAGNQITCTQEVTVEYNILSGNVIYNNAANSPMGNVVVELYDAGSTLVGSTVSSEANSGYFEFTDLCAGDYTFVVSDTSKVGYINATDAGAANAWNAQGGAIEFVNFLAGDVTNDGIAINSTDALRIQQYFVFGTPFDRVPWSFWTEGNIINSNADPKPTDMTVTVSGADVSQNILAMATGDFNGSFGPTLKSAGSSVRLSADRNMNVDENQVFNLPLRSEFAMEVGAVSLILDLPSDFAKVMGVKVNGSNVPATWNVKDNQLRIGWNSLNPVYVGADEALVTLQLKSGENLNEGQMMDLGLVNNPLNEVADGNFNPIRGASLLVAKAGKGLVGVNEELNIDELTFTNYPNPFSRSTTLSYAIPEDGRVNISIYNQLGQLVTSVIDVNQKAGQYTIENCGGNLLPGMYIAKLRLTNDSDTMEGTIKLNVIK